MKTKSYYEIELRDKDGKSSKQREIENRAKKIKKECITNQELEVIIFGEKQE